MNSDGSKASFEPPDLMHLRAAEGWIELGNPTEARQELERISRSLHEHPEVLQVRWHIFAKLKQWDTCAEIGQVMVQTAPDKALGWINYANSLFYQKRYVEAFDALYPALPRFPRNPYLRYNLACYKCQLGEYAVALDWFKKALELGDPKELKQMAQEDRDLEPIWSDIGTL